MNTSTSKPAGSAAKSKTSLAGRAAGVFSRHSVALVSLAVALSGLAYNTWRNETTETQRSTREAGFRMLEELGELQSRVNYRFYAADLERGDRIGGWGHVLFLRDLSALMPADVAADAAELHKVWTADGDALDDGDAAAEKRISGAVSALREEVLSTLQDLR